MIEKVLLIIICHLIGDYVLQCDFIAQTKGKNWYHLFVHCFLYIVPFYFVFGYDWRIWVILVLHIMIDPLKARYDKINYVTDQILHYIVALIYVLG